VGTYARIATGDALAVLRQIPSASIHSCITSPAYWQQRDYEVEGQMGWEPTPQEYISRLIRVFDEVRRVLRDDGTCWVVLGDTYRNKSLALIPDSFAIAMTGAGWILRNRIIWYKTNAMPSSIKDRFTVDFEEMFFFVQSDRYYFEQQIVPYSALTEKRIRRFVNNGERFDPARHKSYDRHSGMRITEHLAANIEEMKGANKRCVWSIPVAQCADPAPENGSSTIPPLGQPAMIGVSINLSG
jgi:site-specific DNA-methyltransferase (adenine-specific)